MSQGLREQHCPLGASQLNASTSIPGTFTYTPAPETILSAGNGLPLTVSFVPTDGEQYASVTRSVSITVNKKPVTATANSVSRPFGVANPALTLSYLGFAGDDTENSLDNPPTLTCGATASSPPGTYDISVAGGIDSNYTIASSKGTLTITKAGQTIGFSPLAAKSYGDGTFSLAGTASSGLPVTYSSSNSSVAILSGQQVVIKSAGTMIITASQGGNANYLAAPSVFQTLTVKKAPLVVKANNLSRTLGAPNPAFSRSTTGFKGSDSTSNVLLDVGFTCSATPQSAIGDYPIVPSGPLALANYTVTYQTGILTITPKILPDITWDKPADIIYGTALGASQLNATSTVSGTFTYSPSAGSLLTAGIEKSLSVIFTPSDSTTYAPITRSVTLTVSKKSLAVTADSMARAYGKTNPELTASYQGFLGTDTSANLDNVPILTCNASTTSSPGAYSILVTGGSDENYAILPTNGTLTITKSPQIIDFSIIPSPSYGVGPIPLKASTSSGSPVTFSSSDPSVASITGNILVVNAAGTTTVTASQSGNINYLSANTSQVLTVKKANLTVKATNQSRTRGIDNPKLLAQFTGLSKSDTADNIGLSFSLTCSATMASESGDYPIIITGPGSTKNYLVSYTPGILTVTPKLVPEIIWLNPADITYGTVLSSSQLNATSSIPGVFTYDPPTGSLLQAGQGIRLSVEFTPQDETLYERSYGTVELAVVKAPLTIQAIDASRIVGSENPEFSCSFSGFMNNESALSLEQQPIMQCSATPTDPPGSYAIIPSGATSANYDINYTEGILTILPPPNSPPRAIDQSYSVISGESLQFMLLGNDAEGSIFTYDYQQPRHGTLTGTQGLVTYQANDNFEGTDSFTFTVTDDDGLLSPSAMVNILVSPRPTSDTTSSADAGATAIKGPNSNSCGLGSGISVFFTTCLAFMSLVRRRRSSSLQS